MYISSHLFVVVVMAKNSDMSEIFMKLMVHVRKISILCITWLHCFVSEFLDFTCVSGFWWFSEFFDTVF